MKPQVHPDPIHRWFGLSYANYLVAHRSILQSMPIAWQSKFVALLEEVDEKVAEADIGVPNYRVCALDENGKFVEDPVPHYHHAPNLFTRSR